MDILITKKEAPPGPTNTEEDIRLEQMKREVKKADLEWDDLFLQ